MSTNTDIELMTETAKSIFESAHTIVSGMQDGERKQIKELAVEVGTVVNMEPKRVLGFVSHFVHHTSLAYVTRGKNGGIIKGTKPLKVVKVKKSQKDDSLTDTD